MKLDATDKICAIESKYPVETIEYKGIKIWPFIRVAIAMKYMYSDETEYISSLKKGVFSKIAAVFIAIVTTSFDIFFKKNAAVIFTHDSIGVIRIVDGIHIDSFSGGIANFEKSSIPIVLKQEPAQITAFSKYINNIIFLFLMKLQSYSTRVNAKQITNSKIIDEITTELGIKFNFIKNVSVIYSYIIIFRKYFNSIKPLRLYILCYYSTEGMTACYVAKQMNIPTIELQHGVISNAHYAYTASKGIYPNPYPESLFCFGEGFRKYISSYIYKPENIYITGRYYFDVIISKREEFRQLFERQYQDLNSKIIVTVAGQVQLDRECLGFIEQVTLLRHDIYFIYVPRKITPYIANYTHKNIMIEKKLDIYQCMQNSHCSSTVFSTCAIESLIFGTPVILINIDGYAKKFYSDFFSSVTSVFYADTPEEYVSYISDALNKDREQVATEGKLFYADGHIERVKKSLEEIIEQI
jgi:hypothetical protein